MIDLTELDKLEDYLKVHDIRYERIDESTIPEPMKNSPFLNDDVFDGFGERHQIIVYSGKERSWDAICHWGSYGYEEGLLEIMGNIIKDSDIVKGWLTADEVIEMFEKKIKVQNI